MERSDPAEGRIYCFGECRFMPDRQLLLHRDVPVRIGSRALDLLHALVQRAGSLVSKDELIRFAWPNTFVDESNLKVNMAYLRRALSQSGSELPYIATVTGRGYRFVAPLHSVGGTDAPALPEAVRAITGQLPAHPPLVGRDEVLGELAAVLTKSRLLTIVGPAGVGKTCVATAAARQLGERYPDGVCFVDLAVIADPEMVAPAIGCAVGLDGQLANITAGLVDHLRNQELLLVLDNCEHVLNAAASVAHQLHHSLPGLGIVATSREPLRCRTEAVYRLAPLGVPAEGSEAEKSAAISFPAVELLVRRAEAHGYRLVQSDLPALAAVSRRLDGIALAIELAAPRLAAVGAAPLVDLLEHGLDVLAARHDVVPTRHRTLVATLDWSYRLLSADEARLLRHLSVFGCGFALEDVVGTVPHLGQTAEDLATWLESLVAKSLLAMSYHRGRQRYRLLDCTRSFAGQCLRSEGEELPAMAGYARYLLSLFEQAEAEWSWRTNEDWTASYGHWGDDLRRAIEWAFGDGDDVELGIQLTEAGIPFWNEFSSVIECRTPGRTVSGRRCRCSPDGVSTGPGRSPTAIREHAGLKMG
jgi:predicted ATPase/DNA-binding winged helix-turn-helix (wHTH) protein